MVSKTSSEKAATVATGKSVESERIENKLSSCVESLPKNYQKLAEKGIPVLVEISKYINALTPIVQEWYLKLQSLWKQYDLEELSPCILGFLMAFFGGAYVCLIAAAEAFVAFGWKNISTHWYSLWEDVEKVWTANDKDNKTDANNDGVADVDQLTSAELLTRKTMLFVEVVDPSKVGAAFVGLLEGLMCVIATLQLQFAKAITLGRAIGSNLNLAAKRVVSPVLHQQVPKKYAKWIEPCILLACQLVAVSLAWTLQRILSGIHSAFRGGLLASRNLILYLKRNTTYLSAPMSRRCILLLPRS
eukprot:Platyproteum_vivax@DN6810_c0_g1_i1.p1